MSIALLCTLLIASCHWPRLWPCKVLKLPRLDVMSAAEVDGREPAFVYPLLDGAQGYASYLCDLFFCEVVAVKVGWFCHSILLIMVNLTI